MFPSTPTTSHHHLPSAISEWNKLPSASRSAGTVLSFKHALNSNVMSVPKFFYTGHRESAIHHARLRMHCSSLNEHLYSKNIVENPACVCGESEDTHHFILTCPLYHRQRSLLFDSLSLITRPDLNTLLFGNGALSDDANHQVFNHVQTYISKTKRFIH